jgi:hypothetical protein
MLANFNFAKCYINDIIILSLTLKDCMHRLQEMFKIFKEYNLQFHLGKCHFFGSYDLFRWMGVQNAKVKMISQVPQLTKISQL